MHLTRGTDMIAVICGRAFGRDGVSGLVTLDRMMRARDVSRPDDEDEREALAVLDELLAQVDGRRAVHVRRSRWLRALTGRLVGGFVVSEQLDPAGVAWVAAEQRAKFAPARVPSRGMHPAPMLITLASLCCHLVAVSRLYASAARVPITLFAAICSPFPEPPITIASGPALLPSAAGMQYTG